jgi:DnaJ family protein A protein 2
MPTSDDYETLGLQPNSSLREIRKAYLTLSMVFHPDKGGDPEQFKKIKAAYENLTGK